MRHLKPGIAEENDLCLAESLSGGLVPTRVTKVDADGFSCESHGLHAYYRYSAVGLNKGILFKRTDDGKFELYVSPAFKNSLETLFREVDEHERIAEDSCQEHLLARLMEE